MAGNRYKFSIEARPLKAIYSKYRDNGRTSPFVRPLGSIRKGKKSSDEKQRSKDQNKGRKHRDNNVDNSSGDVSIRGKETLNREHTKENNMHKSTVDVGDYKNKTEYTISRFGKDSCAFDEPDANGIPGLSRSRSQLFENRFKIAASRTNGQESPSPTLKREVKKRVIQLPLFRVNLKTYPNESEVIRTVAKTRESLRQLMELHRSKMKTPNMIAANIKQYDFNNPLPSPRFNVFSKEQLQNGLVMSQQFPAKPAMKSSKYQGQRDFVRSKQHKKDSKAGATKWSFDQNVSRKFSSSDLDNMDKKSLVLNYKLPSNLYLDEQPGESFSMDTIRPDTALTLGSTMSHIDRVLKSPGSDELREMSEVFTDNQSAWPSFDDYQRLKTQSHLSKTKTSNSFTRSSTMINYQRDLLPPASMTPRTGRKPDNRTDTCAYSHKPVLRYTSQQSAFKLDPIVVPSHTCIDCPMCAVYLRDFETPCPPNSPMSSQVHLNPDNIGQDHTVGKCNRNGRQDLLHISKINMCGSPVDDPAVLNPVKTSGVS